MVWPTSSADLNPVGNLCRILEQHFNGGGEVHVQTEALGGYFGILRRNSNAVAIQRYLKKITSFVGALRSCEAAIKSGVQC